MPDQPECKYIQNKKRLILILLILVNIAEVK
jgi:hypothetical protein